jgi:hypothetical protein
MHGESFDPAEHGVDGDVAWFVHHSGDLGGPPLGVLMAMSGDRNALGQDAVSGCKLTDGLA